MTADIVRSDVGAKIFCYWSGWRIDCYSNRLVAWWSVHLPEGLAGKTDYPPYLYERFACMVQSSKVPREGWLQPGGYGMGCQFNYSNSILLEESLEAMEAIGASDLQSVCDRVFFNEKAVALSRLREYLTKLEIEDFRDASSTSHAQGGHAEETAEMVARPRQ